jgi:hypothetical protein
VQQFKEQFLKNINLLNFDGSQLEDSTLKELLDSAVSVLEAYLDIYIIPVQSIEEKDYHSNDYWQWGYFLLNNVPVIEVTNLIAVYPNSEILQYPTVWLKLQPHDGTIRIIPTAGTLAQFQVDAGGQYFPEIFRYNGNVPLVWQITYTAGFPPGKIPKSINRCVGLLAAIMVLNNMGSGVINPGFTSASLSIDDLSQNISTGMSGTSHAYSGLVEAYYKELFGEQSKNPIFKGLLHQLKTTFNGSFIQIV